MFDTQSLIVQRSFNPKSFPLGEDLGEAFCFLPPRGRLGGGIQGGGQEEAQFPSLREGLGVGFNLKFFDKPLPKIPN